MHCAKVATYPQASLIRPARLQKHTTYKLSSFKCRSLIPGFDIPTPDPESSLQAVYVALTALGVSFALTFGVAPRYKSFFKEEENWRDMYAELVKMGGVESVSPEEAARQRRAGCVTSLRHATVTSESPIILKR